MHVISSLFNLLLGGALVEARNHQRALTNGVVAAYFDVDDTLTHTGTLESFLEHSMQGHRAPRLDEVGELRDFASQSNDLEEIHQRFAALYAGIPWSYLLESGRRWAETFLPTQLDERMLEILREHHRTGVRSVLVSGSWLPCLGPIARYLGVSRVMCSQPVVEHLNFAGRFESVMTGTQKAEAVLQDARAYQIDLNMSFAYGDHDSDFAMLSTVGNPTMVRPSAGLLSAGAKQSWALIPG
ncbi:HAD family hydrolase [Microbacterium sp.]|uniref:HAD family hydrolase n=1 Tax=Microbacterium sp. TaxID=51671 RepID=UPI002764C0CC|nr:HAD-IB family hydrolase [Microbacterium sp.]